MKKFIGGIIFATGVVLLGKTMYELGRFDEWIRNEIRTIKAEHEKEE